MNLINTTTQPAAPLPNPYALYTPLPQAGVALLFAAAFVCFVVGLLLAEGRTLRALLVALEVNFGLQPKSRTAQAAAGEPM